MYDNLTSSSPATLRLHWDVFISFRGEDTRHTFIKTLHTSLTDYGVRAFLDDTGMTQGDAIAPTLMEAIQESASSVIVISPRYANSHWCLEELARICELGRLILPVFYQVDPSNVRRQKGPFEEDFRLHLESFQGDKVDKWREAMRKVGSLSGFVFDGREENQLIRRLANRILTELKKTPIGIATYTVGLDYRVERLERLLDIKSKGIKVLGLYGMGGIGKTTLATALYNKIIPHFGHYRCFLSNVREACKCDGGLTSLQNKLIDVLSSNPLSVTNEIEKKVLLVLDDVDDVSQLNALAGQSWFGEGTRIIITTRDREVLVEHLVHEFYEVRELDSTEALQLFSYHALRREKPIDEYLNLSNKIVALTGRLPLALEVFGSSLLHERRLDKWEDALKKLQQIRPRDLQDVLRISYDGLDDEEKSVFLDIACLFVKMRMKRGEAIEIVKGCGFRAETSVSVLTAKCLVKITEEGSLWMHDQLRDMGRQIVVDENLTDPGMRSRLWDRQEIMTVLTHEKGTRHVQGMILDIRKRLVVDGKPRKVIPSPPTHLCSALVLLIQKWRSWFQRGEADITEGSQVILHTKGLKYMLNLRLLQISHAKVEGNFKCFPSCLKWLQWKGCALKNLPSDYYPGQLAVLDLSESGVERVWASGMNKVAENLMVMNLRGCYNLVAIPDLSGYTALEKLDLELCPRLTTLHKSVGHVESLIQLNLARCSNLVELPNDVSGLKSLQNLILSDCTSLKELPLDIGRLNSLRELLVDGTAITKLPESIYGLTKLEKLSLNDCRFIKCLPNCLGNLASLKDLSLNSTALEELPESVGSLSHLEKLSLMRCSSLVAIPESIRNLQLLTNFYGDHSAIKELPSSIGSLSYLKGLSVSGCNSLTKLPDSIGRLASVSELNLDEIPITDLPDQIGELKMVEKLYMRKCMSLQFLPEAVGNMSRLTTINLFGANIMELPETIGRLEDLVMLRLSECRNLHKLPSSIGKLKSLRHLLMEKTAVTELPETFGMLSSLMVLKMGKKPSESLNTQENTSVLPASFSNLSLLEVLDARAWRFSGKIPDNFEKLSLLETLDLGYNDFCSLPSSLEGLSLLRELLLRHCEKLKSLPPLPSSLEKVDVSNCFALESISDVSNMENLEWLELANCERVVDVPGVEHLKSLRWLFMSGCIACSSAVKRRLSKAFFRNIRVLGMPGSRIPEWFSQGGLTFSERKHHKVRAVIIAVVVSVDHRIPEELRDEMPVVPIIEAKMLKVHKPPFNTALFLRGVPKTYEDQMYLCRYPDSYPLVLHLEEGCTIEITRKPVLEGVHLKQYGIHLVYEDDDDYVGNEESLDESQQSASQRLAKFFNSTEENGSAHIY